MKTGVEMVRAQKGTQDLLPDEAEKWRAVEEVMRSEAAVYGFGEIRTPVFEDTRLFQRSVGETTDVVQKEMYTFNDKGGRSITLRPEGTAGAVRAFLEHGMANSPLPVRLYYFTSCYRYENTQAGRLREFHQFGAESFGSSEPSADAELIGLAKGIFDRLGVRGLSLEINSIGCPACRADYHRALRGYFERYQGELCDTCRGRLERNPMRILDCKSPVCSKIAAGAPKITEYLCEDCRAHFDGVKRHLDAMEIAYTVNASIVRGLDYYTNTVFEFISRDLGAQSTVCGGGRYNGLVEEMGGAPLPALGFAMGIERLMMILQAQGAAFPRERVCDVYLANMGEAAGLEAFRLAHRLRLSSVRALCDENGRSLKAQMKYAGKIGAAYSMVLGDDELAAGRAQLKNMQTGEKTELSLGSGFLEEYCAIVVRDQANGAFNAEA